MVGRPYLVTLLSTAAFHCSLSRRRERLSASEVRHCAMSTVSSSGKSASVLQARDPQDSEWLQKKGRSSDMSAVSLNNFEFEGGDRVRGHGTVSVKNS